MGNTSKPFRYKPAFLPYTCTFGKFQYFYIISIHTSITVKPINLRFAKLFSLFVEVKQGRRPNNFEKKNSINKQNITRKF